jgi:hypothetical protein
MDSELANEGIVPAGKSESTVPFNLTLQWLESNPNNWPANEAALLKRIKEFCTVEVKVSADAVVNALEEIGAVQLGAAVAKGESKTVLDKQSVQVAYDNMETVQQRIAQLEGSLSTATRAVLGRVVPLLIAFRASKKEPRTRGELEDLVAPHTLVVFRANPRAVLDELEVQEYLEVSAKSDEIIYDGPRIVNWRAPPVNKGFGCGSFLLVLLILLMLVPGLSKLLNIF